MMRSRLGSIALSSVAVLGVALATPALAQTESGTTVPTYQEFKAQTFIDADKQYVVNGDEPVGTNGDLQKFYDRMVGEDKHVREDGLVVNTVFGRDDKWSATQAMNLTYCISNKFGTQKTNIVNAMNAGVAMWEGATTKVNYTYVPSQDASCTTRNTAVVFSVEPTSTTQYIARAFFPSTAKRSRNVLVNAASLMNSGSWTPGNIMGHELGHTLGFRHEHTRPEAGTCFEDNNWRPLTAYDRASIMHYPQCNGSSEDRALPDPARAGVRALYGAGPSSAPSAIASPVPSRRGVRLSGPRVSRPAAGTASAGRAWWRPRGRPRPRAGRPGPGRAPRLRPSSRPGRRARSCAATTTAPAPSR